MSAVVQSKPVPAPEKMAEDAIELILAYYSKIHAPVNEADLVERSRQAYTIRVRTMVAYFLKTECHWSYKAIGERLQRDHSSVIEMVRRVSVLVPQEERHEVIEFTKDRVIQRMEERRDAALRDIK